MQTADNTPTPATSQSWEPMHLEDGAPTYYRGYPVRTSALNAELIYDPSAEPGREYRVYVEFNPTEDGSLEVGISEFREAMGALNRLLWQSYGVPLNGAPQAPAQPAPRNVSKVPTRFTAEHGEEDRIYTGYTHRDEFMAVEECIIPRLGPAPVVLLELGIAEATPAEVEGVLLGAQGHVRAIRNRQAKDAQEVAA